jgi:hypothetical protein
MLESASKMSTARSTDLLVRARVERRYTIIGGSSRRSNVIENLWLTIPSRESPALVLVKNNTRVWKRLHGTVLGPNGQTQRLVDNACTKAVILVVCQPELPPKLTEYIYAGLMLLPRHRLRSWAFLRSFRRIS